MTQINNCIKNVAPLALITIVSKFDPLAPIGTKDVKYVF